MNKRETHIVTGMTRDLAANRVEPSLVYDAHNIRIRVVGNNSTLLSVTNEKGTSEFEITNADATIKGTIIGSASFTNTLVLFTVDTEEQEDYIYRVDFDETFDTATLSLLFDGAFCMHTYDKGLNFSIEHPIEALAVYENDEIQKVYWVDGINQPRMINICKGEQNNPDAFNFNREIGVGAKMSITKYNSGGEFRPGTIQYCFNYFNKFAQETNIVDVSPLYYISPKESGLAADDTSGCSFEITLSNLNTDFDFVRLYAIYRSSENATPNVRIVGDYAISKDSDDSISVVDTGTFGSTIDASSLLFMGGQYIIAGTLAEKDNTLFLGNIKNAVPNIGDIEVSTQSGTFKIKDIHDHTGEDQTLPVELWSRAFDYDGNPARFYPEEDIPVTAYTVPKITYKYSKNNNRSSFGIKSFKARENYRLGFIAQYKTGQWSEAIWLGDFTEKCLSGLYWFFNNVPVDSSQEPINPWGKQYRSAGFYATIESSIVDTLINNGFIKICPVVVYPSLSDRYVLCQGLVCPTVFNAKDRIDNSPYTQCDWRFRLGYSWNRIADEIQSNATSAFGGAGGDTDSYAPSVPFAYFKKQGESFARMNFGEFIQYFPTEFYLDPSVVSFHSPDIDSSDELIKEDFNNIKLRLVGFSNGGFSTFRDSQGTEPVLDSYLTTVGFKPKSVLHSFISMESTGLGDKSKVLTPNDTFSYDLDSTLRLVGYYDSAVDTSVTDKISRKRRDQMDNLYFQWYTYLWHRNGSLNNHEQLTIEQKEANGQKTGVYRRKVMSEKTYGYTTYFYNINAYSPQTDYAINVSTVDSDIFDSDQKSFIRIDTAFDYDKAYYGNIDKVLTTPLEDNSSVQFYDVTTDESNPTNGNNNSTGYPIRTALAGTPTPTSHYIDFYEGIEPTQIRYKTTRHAVISLGGHDDSEIAQIGRNTMDSYYIYWLNQNKYFAGSYLRDEIYGRDNSYQHFDYSFVDECIYVGELYRNFSSAQNNARFGGNSQEAIAANVWTLAGEAVDLVSGNNVTIDFKEGDTYFGRYECLKAYPYSQEDKQSIVSIYSTELESRVNLDFRYGNTMNLDDNTLVTPQNFNLYNHEGYEQTNQFFTYKALDYDRYVSQNFPNMITWSLEKTFGEDVDSWTSIPLTNTLDLDGTKGEVTKLARFNNEIFSFQNNGFAQILFNSRVQIPVSDGQPIEITNGYKVDGKRYISETIGMSNKWSLGITPQAMYFIDDSKNTLYAFSGQLIDLSTTKGMKTWLYDNGNDFRPVWNPRDYGNVRTFYDRIYGDLYFTTEKYSLVYSEILGNFTSFMDYGGVASMNNIGNKFLSFTTESNETSKMWEMWEGDYNMFFGEFKPYWITFISNTDPTMDKVFNNLEWRSVSYDAEGNYIPYDTFDTLRVWHEHQDTGCVSLEDKKDTPSILKKKFNAFRTFVPRDYKGVWSLQGMQRIRNPWAYIRLAKTQENTNQMIFTDLNVDFFE